MAEEDGRSSGRAGIWLAGAVALAAWFAMLWFMFGEVL